MSTYAIGDIQGCYWSLYRLLDLIEFDPEKDRLWLAGDLVSRGPDSLAVLRWAKSLGDRVVSVLGNHDLHLLEAAERIVEPKKDKQLHEILNAPDRDELLTWLRHKPLLYTEDRFALVHAGLLPQWSVEKAMKLADEVHQVLHHGDYLHLLRNMRGDKPNRWRDDLRGMDRLRVIVNAMARMRVITPDGRMRFHYTGDPDSIPMGYLPWDDAPNRKSADKVIICGHWAARGLVMKGNLISLDSGCVWGGSLTAVRLEDNKLFRTPCPGAAVNKKMKKFFQP